MVLTEIHDDISLTWTSGGGSLVRSFLADELATPPTNPTDSLGIALLAGLPSFASGHPSIRNLYVSGYAARAFPEGGKSGVKIAVMYATPSPGAPLGAVYVEIAGSNGQMILNRWPGGDQRGQPILVGYNPDLSRSFPAQNDAVAIKRAIDADATNGDKFDTAEIPIEAPNAIVKLTRTEYSDVTRHFPYRHTINKTTWLGFNPRTVFLRDVQVCKVFGIGGVPDHYICSYIFEVVPDSTYWQRVEFFRDIHTGKPIAGVNLLDFTNNGYAIVDPYPFADFNDLGFPNI